jgi:predicted small integral membrane protein
MSSTPETSFTDRRWRGLGTLPVVIAVLAFFSGLQMALIAFGNISDFGTNLAFVEGVLGMQTTNFGGAAGSGLDPDVMWHAITDPTLQVIGYVVIIVWESLAAIVLIAAVVQWIRERGRGYATARALTSIGLLMILILFVGGFIVIGGEWFQMWRSTSWNGLDSALRYSLLALIPMVLVHLPSEHWRRVAAVDVDR